MEIKWIDGWFWVMDIRMGMVYLVEKEHNIAIV
jgi:hypothetical protein